MFALNLTTRRSVGKKQQLPRLKISTSNLQSYQEVKLCNNNYKAKIIVPDNA